MNGYFFARNIVLMANAETAQVQKVLTLLRGAGSRVPASTSAAARLLSAVAVTGPHLGQGVLPGGQNDAMDLGQAIVA